MHNLHLVTIKSSCPEFACADVEGYILDFGNDNNWRTICGCVSEKNEVYVYDKESRYSPHDYNTIQKINKLVMGWIKTNQYDKIKKKLIKTKGKLNHFNWIDFYELEECAKHYREVKNLKSKTSFNVLKNNFFPYSYDMNGVTQCEEESAEPDENNNLQLYVVFVDMHS